MILDIVKIAVFMLLINWSMSMQILNQNTTDKRIKIVAITLAMIFAATAGYLLI